MEFCAAQTTRENTAEMTTVTQGKDITDRSSTVVRFTTARQQSCYGHRVDVHYPLHSCVCDCLSNWPSIQTNKQIRETSK
jgi:hypothetical protein